MASQQNPHAEEPKGNFRRALGQFPTGVTVITAIDDQNRPVGVTASSFNSVSQNPPLILWSVDKNALSAEVFSQAEHFAVNILGKHQIDIANNFARSSKDKFANIPYSNGKNDCPILEDLAACLECRTWSIYEGGDHLIIVGEVMHYRYRDYVVPLIFAQSSYAIPAQNMSDILRNTAHNTEGSSNGFLNNYLLYQLWAVHSLYASDLYQLLLEECGVIPEEWRVLTLLLDNNGLTIKDLAEAISQPPDDCLSTLVRMQANDYLTLHDEGLVRMTEAGLGLAKRLVHTAEQHEAKITSALAEGRREQLAQDLKEVLTILKHRNKH